jgi:hypothetical protein
MSEQIDKFLNQALDESEKFFEIKLERPEIVLVPDRNTINKLLGRQTENWLVGWADKGTIYLLDSKNFEKESNHKYSDEEFYKLIKHEVCHMFVHKIAKIKIKPYWLSEGIPIYVSGQYENKKLAAFHNFTKNYDSNIDTKSLYNESGFAIKFLVEKYGKEKIFELIRNIQSREEEFNKYFEKLYGFLPTIESFNKLLTETK